MKWQFSYLFEDGNAVSPMEISTATFEYDDPIVAAKDFIKTFPIHKSLPVKPIQIIGTGILYDRMAPKFSIVKIKYPEMTLEGQKDEKV